MDNMKKMLELNNSLNSLFLFNEIPIVLVSDLTNRIDLKLLKTSIERTLSRYRSILVSEIDGVYIGDFGFLKKHNLSAQYRERAIYISNIQDDSGDLLDDVLHEAAHVIEATLAHQIYGDRSVEEEFQKKKKYLQNACYCANINVDLSDPVIDNELYVEIGYERLKQLIPGIFVSVYSPTSIREYFATGFHEFYLGSRSYLEDVCPALFNKIQELDGAQPLNERNKVSYFLLRMD